MAIGSRFRAGSATVLFLLVWSAQHSCFADVVVICNRTPAEVRFSLRAAQSDWKEQVLASGRHMTVRGAGAAGIAFDAGDEQRVTYPLRRDAVYCFTRSRGRLALHRADLGGGDAAAETADRTGEVRGSANEAAGSDPPQLTVKILIDEEERASRQVWEARLRRRMAKASDILQDHCDLRLEVVAVERWNSDDTITDLGQSLRQFASVVEPAPAQMAIGFTAQTYATREGRTRLGGARGPLRSHILIQEWPGRVSEPERLEVLVHELGHFLGAVHSPESDSVMRPNLADGQARRRDFPIRFDPVNSLLIALVAEQLPQTDVGDFFRLAPATKKRLREIYASIHGHLPGDLTAARFQLLLGQQAAGGNRD